MRTTATAAGAVLIVLSASVGGAEVIDLRLGYWQSVWSIPGEPPQREFFCLTPEELERMRFFINVPNGCTTSHGSQTRRHYEATSVCEEDGERMKIRFVVQSPDPMRFDVSAVYEFEGKTQAATGTYNWLQESCSAAGKMPNS
jgi:hypothetical protein